MKDADRRPRTILVVDDMPEMRLALKDWLEGRGYEVVEAEDGDRAVEIAQNSLPGLILMDVDLPRRSGISAVYLIRKNPRLRDVPIVAMTAHTATGLHQSAIKAGCLDVLAKPINTDRLKKLLDDL
jgi:CheY-like chemotaxis protein